MKKKIISVLVLMVILFSSILYSNTTSKAAPSIELVTVKIPQNKEAVSTTKWKTRDSSNNILKNVCYDYLASRRPYSNWMAIDYDNTTGKANYEDRVLRQATIRVWKDTTNAYPVTLTTSATNCYIHTNTITTGGPYVDFYAEFYGDARTISFTAKVGTGSPITKSFDMTSVTVDYNNIFFITFYKFGLYTGGSWSVFENEVNINGSGYDQVNDQWYRYGNPIKKVSASEVYTASQTMPTAGRTIAVDSPYITRKTYNGGSGSKWHRARVLIKGLVNSQDNGKRTAEDSGSEINGYHIDVFIGFETPTSFTSKYPSLTVDTGKHCSYVSYLNTLLGGTLQ